MTGKEIARNDHQAWGDSMNFLTPRDISEISKLAGWLKQTPKKGDIFLSEMASGKIAKYLLIKVDKCSNPPDMFFADCIFVGYKETKGDKND